MLSITEMKKNKENLQPDFILVTFLNREMLKDTKAE